MPVVVRLGSPPCKHIELSLPHRVAPFDSPPNWMKFVYCDMKKVATLLRTSATPRRAARRRHREPRTIGCNELFAFSSANILPPAISSKCSARKSQNVRVGLSPNGLLASRFQDKRQIWDRKNPTCFSPSRIVTFLPVQKKNSNFFVPAGPKCDVLREGCDKKRHKLKKTISCARTSHSSQKCDKCYVSHFLSPKKVTNMTSLTQIWNENLERNSAKTDP